MPSEVGADVLIRPPGAAPGFVLCRGAGLCLVHTRVEYPILGKKERSHPIIGTRAQTRFVVPPNFRRCKAPLSPSVAGRRPHPSPGPLLTLSSSGPFPQNPFSRGGSSLLGGNRATHAPSRRWMDLMLPQNGEKVKSYRAKGTRLGFITSRQSRSPRARPWIRSSAVATLVAMGTECWSHRREM